MKTTGCRPFAFASIAFHRPRGRVSPLRSLMAAARMTIGALSAAARAALCAGMALLTLAVAPVAAADVGLLLAGGDFTGGARQRFGGAHHGEPSVNYVYARSTGELSAMKATFDLGRLPAAPQFVHLKGRDDDQAAACRIEVKLNGTVLLAGRSPFPSNKWAVKPLAIPDGVLKTGTNELVIANAEAEGPAGNPPWFMIAACGIGGENFVIRRDVTRDFFVTLPAERRPFPEPLPEGRAEPGFSIRGTKGWNWTAGQYLAEVPVLAKYKMNFLMNCYLSMFDQTLPWSGGEANRWWEPVPEEKRRDYERVVKACQQHGIEFCFAVNPNLTSKRILRYDSAEDLDALWQNYEWMAGLGVNWFSVCLDDISNGIDPKGQARAVNALYRRLKTRNPKARMIFCPTIYWGMGEKASEAEYLDALGAELDRDVYCFWTGDAVVGRISRPAAEEYRRRIGHRLIVWDNYPVNDSAPTLHLGPVTGRDPDLCVAAEGYMSNAMCPQNEINRLPLLTIADYAYNPWNYDPGRSIGQAILQLTDSPAQREALSSLAEAYPGMLLYNGGTGLNPVREQYNRLSSSPHSRYIAQGYVRQMAELAERFGRSFPERYADARKTLEADVAWMKAAFEAKYAGDGESALVRE